MLDNMEKDKIKSIYSAGKARYILRHGMLNWGLSTGIIFRILSIISKVGWNIREIAAGIPTLSTLVAMLVFSIFGGIWGAFFWRWIEKEAIRLSQDPGKNNKNKKKK